MLVKQETQTDVQGDELARMLFRNLWTRAQGRTSIADEIIAHAKRVQGWKFIKMKYRGTATLPFTDNNMEYRILESDDTTPDWAVKRVSWVKEEYPERVKEIVVGHELEDPLANTEEIIIKAGRAVKVAVLGITMLVAAIAIASILVAAVAVLFVTAAVVSVPAVMLDPQLIVILNDEQETWILCAEWQD